MISPATFQQPTAWDSVEAGYSDLFAPVLARYARAAVELARPDRDARVLDVAAGPGTLAFLVAAEVGHVSALDFSPVMIERLRAEARGRGLTNVEAVVGDGQALPYADAEFDAAFSMFGLIFFPDRALGLRELRRVLRPSGRAVIGSWAPLDPGTPPVVLSECLRAAQAGPGSPPLELPLATPEAMHEALADAGFEQIEVSRVTHEFFAADVDAFWAVHARANVLLAPLLNGMAADARERLATRVVGELRDRLGGGEIRYSQTALLGLGVRGA